MGTLSSWIMTILSGMSINAREQILMAAYVLRYVALLNGTLTEYAGVPFFEPESFIMSLKLLLAKVPPRSFTMAIPAASPLPIVYNG